MIVRRLRFNGPCSMRFAVAILLIASAYGGAAQAKELPGEGITVKPCFDQLIEVVFQTEVVKIGLERLGYQIADYANVTIPMMYVATAQGDVDFCADAYDPLQQAYFEKAGGDEKMTRVGVLVEPAVSGYLIDKRTAEKENIVNLGQLSDPNIARLFDADDDGKADLAGCPPGWGCERVIEHHMDAYGLRDTVTHHQGEFLVMAADTIAKYNAGESILYFTYTPLWVSQILVPGHDVEYLEVPFTALPGKANKEETEMTTLPDGKNIGFPLDQVRILANNGFLEENPSAKRFFELVHIPVEDVNAQNLKVHKGEKSMTEIRRHAEEWVQAHEQEFSQWVEHAKNAAN